MHAHEDNEGVYAAHELTPFDLAALTCLVASYDGNARRARAVSNWYAGVSGSSNRRTDSRNDFVGDSRAFQSGRLFTSPAEHEGISALEPDYQLAFARFANEKLLDLSLIDAALTGLLADVNQFGARRGVFQQFGANQSIVKNNLRPLQTIFALQGEQIRISRPCADEVNFADQGNRHLSLSRILAHRRYFCWIWIKLSASGGGDVLHRGDRLHFREDRCLSIGQVQCKACKDKTPENISERHRYLVPQPPVGERDLRAENHSGRDHKHIDYRMFKPLAKESKDGQPHGDNLTDRGLGRKRHHHSHRHHPVAENGLNEDRRKTGMTQLGVVKSLGFARGDKHLRQGRRSR